MITCRGLDASDAAEHKGGEGAPLRRARHVTMPSFYGVCCHCF
jgi:hypothetical protein